jgi:hypothetical protein
MDVNDNSVQTLGRQTVTSTPGVTFGITLPPSGSW